ncbi:MAG TPA: Tox-REase-5 domain-containing protein, partial [Pirellulaceae bacterium]|nr:Tox-REase-5 domain-containing protein [Pirellulaceae bacterium]
TYRNWEFGPKQSINWLNGVFNLTWHDAGEYVSNVADFYYGYFVEAPTNIVTGLYELVIHHQEVLQAIGYLMQNPSEAVRLIGESLWEQLQTSRGQGALIGEVALSLIPITKLKEIAALARHLKRVKHAAGAADRAGDASRLTATAGHASHATQAAKHSLDDLPMPASASTQNSAAGQVLSGGCFVPGTPVRLCAALAMATVGGRSEATTNGSAMSPTTMAAIEHVALGTRVPDQNPRPKDYDFSLRDVDQETWRQVDVRLRRQDGAVVEMQLLRPIEWVENLELGVGSEFKLFLSEFEVAGNAVVTAIGPCCEIAEGEGSVVTGRMVTRQVSNLVTVTLENGTTFTGTTTHPVWEPDKEEWVKLEDLEEGARLEALSGPLRVTTINRLARVSDVFNIEVHCHHVYRIGNAGILVHNNSINAPTRVRGQWQNVNEAMSARARAYQQQITGRSGQSYFVDGVKFDGVIDEVLIEVKGPGYSWAVRNGRFRTDIDYRGANQLVDQAVRQTRVAGGNPIRWHVAEADTAQAIRNLFECNPLINIEVVHSPILP